MDRDAIRLVVEAEKKALMDLDDEGGIEASFTCPICGGTAKIALHEWLGHTSSCENGCF